MLTKLQPGSLGAVGYDDEGVKTKQWDLVKDGILVNYQGIRDQVHISDKMNHTDAATLKAGAMYNFNACRMYRWRQENNHLHLSK